MHNTSQLYSEFEQLKLYDSKRVYPNWKKAQEAKQVSAELALYLTDVKRRLIRETEGFKHREEDTVHLGFVKNIDDFNTTTRILIGSTEDGSAGIGREIKNKLNAYRQKMMSLLDPEDQKNVHFSIDTKDPARTEDESSANWELYNFYHSPLAAVVTILSKFETDAKDAESEVVEHLLSRSSGETIPFDTIAAKVVAESNYVMLGEKFKADIFIAAFNKTLKTEVLAGDYNPLSKLFSGKVDSVLVSKGMGRYSAATSSEGIKKVKGVIRMLTPKGKLFEYPYESEYIVARPALTVSAEKMNVMYAGLVNPISVSVPGIPNDRLNVSIDNGVLKAKGNGKFDVLGPSAGLSKVTVMALMANGERRSMGKIEFRVKDLPLPSARIGDLTSGGKMKKSTLLALESIYCVYEKFDFEAKAKVVSYTFTSRSASSLLQPYLKTGALIDDAIRKIIRKANAGDQFTFENMIAIGADGKTVKLKDITITLY
jgi:gliding motility-associated protein GldM